MDITIIITMVIAMGITMVIIMDINMVMMITNIRISDPSVSR